jgi:predicted peptidase
MSKFQLHRALRSETHSGYLHYLMHQPPGFAEEPRPLLVFLHGSEQRGDDLQRVTECALPAAIERGRNVPFVTISPQCPRDRWWADMTVDLMEMLDTLDEELHIDTRRVYLTGVSMGGYGAWKLAAEHPDAFAALVPICAGGEDAWTPALRSLPTWAFHGDRDTVVDIEESRRMVRALAELGAPARLTELPGVGHECWDQVYDDPAVFDWLLGQQRPEGSLTPLARLSPEHQSA